MPEPLVNSLGYPQRNLIRPNRMPLSVLSHTVCPACSKKILKLLHFEDFHPATNDTISLQRGRFEPRTAPDLCFQPIFFPRVYGLAFFLASGGQNFLTLSFIGNFHWVKKHDFSTYLSHVLLLIIVFGVFIFPVIRRYLKSGLESNIFFFIYIFFCQVFP